jgi:hypothetical protein
MPFEVLDFLMYLLAEERMGPPELLDALRVNWTDGEFRVMCPSYDPAQTPGQWVDKFVRLFWQNVFKWESAPLGTHVGSLDLSRTDALRCPVVSARGGMEPIGK